MAQLKRQLRHRTITLRQLLEQPPPEIHAQMTLDVLSWAQRQRRFPHTERAGKPGAVLLGTFDRIADKLDFPRQGSEFLLQIRG